MRSPIISDRVLIQRYRKGDEKALEQIMHRYKNKVFTAVLYTVKDRALAEDIFQETFIKVIDILRNGKYNEEGKFLPWVMRISHNLCIDHFRKAKRMNIVSNDEGIGLYNMIEHSEASHHERLEMEQSQQKIRDLLDMLPPEQKDVVMLRHYFDFSFKEIAEMQGINLNTALGRMRYGLINLRKLIAEKKISI